MDEKQMTKRQAVGLALEYYSDNGVFNEELDAILSKIAKEAKSGKFYFYEYFKKNLGRDAVEALAIKLRLLGFSVSRVGSWEGGEDDLILYSISWIIFDENYKTV